MDVFTRQVAIKVEDAAMGKVGVGVCSGQGCYLITGILAGSSLTFCGISSLSIDVC